MCEQQIFFNFIQLKSVEKNVPKNILLTFFIGTYLGKGHKICKKRKKTKHGIPISLASLS